MDVTILHDQENTKFYAEINGEKAYLEYILREPTIVEYHNTQVPLGLRNQTIATQIVEEAISWARKNNYQILATCSFVADYMDKHSEHDNARVKNYDDLNNPKKLDDNDSISPDKDV